MSRKKEDGSSTPSPKKTARSRTPSGTRTVKSVDPVQDTSKDAPVSPVTVSGTSTGSKAADEVEERIDEPPKKEEPAPKVSVTTVTVEKKKEANNLAILAEKLDTKYCVGVVYVMSVAFLCNKWNPDMMCAFGISALMACITLYSLDRNEMLTVTGTLLAVLGIVGSFVTPEKALKSIEATMQNQAAFLSTKFAKHRAYKKAGEECFNIMVKDPQSPLGKKYERIYGKPFEPRKDGDWDQYSQFVGCEIKRK
jgi:hypothetical protein